MKIFLKTNKNVQKDFRCFIDQNLKNVNLNIIENVKIAGSEAIQNIYRHAYKNVDGKSIEIKLTIKNNEIIIDICDEAEPCNPENFINKKYIPSDSGKMGITIINKLTKSFKILPKEHGNHTQLIYRI